MNNPTPDWKKRCEARRKQQLEQIPEEWLIDLPNEERLNVTEVPLECGLLSPRELEITENTNIGLLLDKLAKAEWSSVEVTTAYYKRAIVAHQLVCSQFS